MVQIYNKAIRDRIPEIIQARGQKCIVTTLSDADFLVEMERKLLEEVEEYKAGRSTEELADILEVVYRIAELKGVKREALEKASFDKEVARGAFRQNLFLLRIE